MPHSIPLSDMPVLIDWAADEGWNPGLEDAAAFHAADPQGFWLKHQGGQPVSGISVVNHSDSFAFLGLYLCAPEFRGQGHGLEIWTAALAHAGARTVGLDGVPDQQNNYRRSGFVLAGQTVRWQGWLAGQAGGAQALTADDLPHLIALDRASVGFDRLAFLNHWFRDTDTRKTLGLKQGGRITAYGTIRQCRLGTKIGPFAADTARDAETLLAALLACFPDAETMIDIPAAAPDLANLLKSHGFTPGFETARMYCGPAPQTALPNYSSVATLELG